MANLFATLIPYGALGAQLLLLVLFAAVVSRKSWGRSISEFLGKHALVLGLAAVLSAIIGSLFYSEVMHFAPCPLCWWQRVLLFPQFVLFLTALKYKDHKVFRYAWRLSVLALIIGLYQSYTSLGGSSLLPCTAVGGACSRVYVLAFGFITIPLMSATVSLYVILFSWARKLYENSHA